MGLSYRYGHMKNWVPSMDCQEAPRPASQNKVQDPGTKASAATAGYTRMLPALLLSALHVFVCMWTTLPTSIKPT